MIKLRVVLDKIVMYRHSDDEYIFRLEFDPNIPKELRPSIGLMFGSISFSAGRKEMRDKLKLGQEYFVEFTPVGEEPVNPIFERLSRAKSQGKKAKDGKD